MDQTEWAVLLHRAQRGNAAAQYEVAFCYDQGSTSDGVEIVAKNGAEAIRWLRVAHENGNIKATNRLADYLSEGINCEKNENEAIRLYNKAIAGGHDLAAINLATVYRDRGDLETAFNMYQVAQRIRKTDLIQVAFCYHFGVGVKTNQAKAFESFSRIAENANDYQYPVDVDEANYQLGMYYLHGDVVAKSIETARKHFHRANRNDDHDSARKMLVILGVDDSKAS
ncbi:MAG: tetratricopeptide repeat protein [Flavitalea sp.]